MPYSYNKLRGRIVEMYGTQERFAEALGMTKQGLSLKMTGKTEFSQRDMNRWCELLNIPKEQIVDYFFA